MQRKQHQPDTDEGRAATLTGIGVALAQHDAGQNEERRQPCHTGCENPGGDGGADIGTEKNDLRHARADQITLGKGGDGECCGGRTLERDGCEEAGDEGAGAVAGAGGKDGSKLQPEGTRDAILDLRQTEQQQRDRSEQIDDNDGGFHERPLLSVYSVMIEE